MTYMRTSTAATHESRAPFNVRLPPFAFPVSACNSSVDEEVSADVVPIVVNAMVLGGVLCAVNML